MTLDVRSVISRGITRSALARARQGWIGLQDLGIGGEVCIELVGETGIDAHGITAASFELELEALVQSRADATADNIASAIVLPATSVELGDACTAAVASSTTAASCSSTTAVELEHRTGATMGVTTTGAEIEEC